MQATSTLSRKMLAYVRRLIVLIWGLFLCSVGILFTYRSDMGLGPWDVLHKGVSLHTPLSFGQASIVVGGLIILVGLCLRVRPGVGTVLNMLLIGFFVDIHLRLNWLPDLGAAPLIVRLVADVMGVFLMGLGTAFYISPRLGAGPRDGLMLRLNVLTGLRIAIVRGAIEFSALVIGFFLGGTVGVGTLIFAFGVGPAVEIGFWIITRFIPALAPLRAGALARPAHTLESVPALHRPASRRVGQRSSK